jgi:hypothetical protein
MVRDEEDDGDVVVPIEGRHERWPTVDVLDIIVPASGRWGAIGCENQFRHRIKTQGVRIRDFVVCLLERTGVSSQAVVLSLLYAKRIVVGAAPPSPQRLFLGTLMLASRVPPSRSLRL